jgi:TP901 family phage tail tape measure protein
MANRLIRGLTIKIGADTSALGAALQSAEKQVKSAGAELKEINKALSVSGDSAELWNQKQQVVTKALEESRKKLDTLKAAQKSLSDQLRDGDIDKAAYDKFQDKLTKARDRLTELKKQQEQIEAQFRSGEIDKAAYDKFVAKVERAELKVRDLETAEHSLEENLRLGNISEEQYRAFRREIESTEGDIKYFSGQLGKTEEKLREMGGAADDAGEDTEELGKKAETTANGGLTVFTLALGHLVAEGIKTAAQELKNFTADVVKTGTTFEASMSSVGAISGASAADMQLLTDKAKEMGAQTKFTAAETADAFQYMAMAGWKTEDMLEGINGILSLAAASGENLGTTSDIVTDALTAFGLSAEDTQHFVDVLAAASSNANTNVSMMGETFKYAAPIAGSLGFSIEDTAEAIGLMANSGIKASMAGTSLRTIMTNLTDGITLTGKAFAEAGEEIGEYEISATNADGSMRELSEILGDVRGAWDQLTESEKSANAEEEAGKNAMSGFLALVNAAPADIEKLTNAIEDSDSAAQGMSDTMMDNLQGDITLFQSAVDGMKISLSDKLTPTLRDTVQYVTKKMPDIERVLDKVFTKGAVLVKGAVEHLPEIVETGERLIPVITGVGGALGTLMIAKKADTAYQSVKTLTKGFDLLSAVTNASAGGIAGVAAALVIGTGSYIYAAHKAEEARLDEVYRKATEEADALAKSVHNDTMKMQELQKAAADQVRTDFADIYITENLYRELTELVDENGKVKSEYEDRVSFITGRLTEATGVEIQLVDGQIQKYKELQATIEETIRKQRAGVFRGAYSEMYAEAMSQNAGAADRIISLEDNITASKQKIAELRESYKAMLGADTYSSFAGELGELSERTYLNWIKKTNSYNWTKYDEINTELRGAGDSVIESETSLRQERAQIERNNWVIQQYEKADEQYYAGKYESAEYCYRTIDDLSMQSMKKQISNNEEALKSFEDTVAKAKKIYDTETKEGIKDADTKFKNTVKEAGNYLTSEMGVSADDARQAVINALSQIDHFDTAALIDFCQTVGVSVGDVLGSMAREQFNQHMNNISAAFDKAIDMAPGFAASAIQRAKDRVLDKINSLRHFASGGELREGEGIVAEAGPELIRIANGTAHITPLTAGARNTPVQAGDRRSVIYNQITVNATVSGRYDVRKLGAELARETKHEQEGLGL